MADNTSPHGSLLSAATPRLRARKRAEWRLKAFGMGAIFAAGLALLSLLVSVIGQARYAVTEAYITMPVTLEAAGIDPDGTRDHRTILRADYAGMTKDTLKMAFPDIKGRSARKALYGVVSGGASFELAELVADDPTLIGQTINYRFLASDVSDLYLKDAYGTLEASETAGRLTLEQDGKEVVLTSTAPDFHAALLRVKKMLGAEAKRMRHQAALQNNGAVEFSRRAEEGAVEDREKNLKLAEARGKKRDALLGAADDLQARATSQSGAEELDESKPSLLVNVAGGWIKLTSVDSDRATGKVLIAPQTTDVADTWSFFITELPEDSRKISDVEIVVLETLKTDGQVDQVFNKRFFTSSDSREPELAGIWGAVVGSFLTMLVTFSLAFPIGVAAAIYLEEFAPKNKFTDFVEVNINNLAAVPSIVFGLLGLSVFLGVFGVPRSAPLAGGIVLALMTLPTIIIASRAAIKAVPPSIRDAALGVGASRVQTTFHHVLPLAMPGILTGTIIGMAQALGETAPLIMIGMVAFIVDIPTSITDSSSVLPVQVFRWSDFPERAFDAKTGAAICVLLVFLVIMNAVAILLRRRFERRW